MQALVVLLALATCGAAYDVPRWTPTYNMTRSTIVMPCNESGFSDPHLFARFGIADFDWSNWIYGENQTWDGKQYGGYSEQVPETCQQNLRVQAAMTKAANNDTKVFVYRNMVKALPWYKAVREKLVDPDFSGFFLPFKDASSNTSVPRCDSPAPPQNRSCSRLYHDQEQTPHGECGVPCGESREGF